MKLLNIDLFIIRASGTLWPRCLGLLCGGLLVSPVLSFSAAAQNDNEFRGSSSDIISQTQAESLLGSPAYRDIWNVENKLSLQNESFVSTDYSSTPQRSFMFMGAAMISKPDDSIETPVHVDAKGLFSPDSPVLSTFNISEVYYTQDNFSIGRKRITWSQGDEDWNLGLMQPQYRWNVLRPVSQGLTGTFLRLGQGSMQGWNVQLFGSPLFIPDQGAGYQLSNGRFQKVSPWFQTLPQEVALAGSQTVRRLEYDVEVPQIEKIVMNSGYAAQLTYEKAGAPYRFSAGLAYKPRNMLSMGIDGWAEAGSKAPVVIIPSVSYHRLATADLETRSGPMEWRLGFAYEISDEPRDQRPDLTYALYRPMLVSTTSLGYLTSDYETRLLFLHRNGGDLYAEGPKAQNFMDILPQRIPFKDAVALEVRARPWRSGVRSLELSTRWTEGVSETYSRWTMDATFRLSRQWSVWTDFVFVRARKEAGSDPDIFADFENHDSIRTGVTYAF